MRIPVRALIVTVVTVAGWLLLVRYGERTGDGMSACQVSYVYDGDTVALRCDGTSREITARVVGLDAPETKSPGCDAELAHGTLATERLRQLVARGGITLRRLGQDKYGRVLIRLRVQGEDVADRLVREGLAVAYGGGRRIDWCRKLGAP